MSKHNNLKKTSRNKRLVHSCGSTNMCNQSNNNNRAPNDTHISESPENVSLQVNGNSCSAERDGNSDPQRAYEHQSSIENPSNPSEIVQDCQESSTSEAKLKDQPETDCKAPKSSKKDDGKNTPPSEDTTSTEEETYLHATCGLFLVRSIPGDGNCLFRAMAHYVFGDHSLHKQVRMIVVSHVVLHWNYFKNFATDKDSSAYYERMLEVGTYGSELEIVAFARVFGCGVEVFMKSSPERDPLSFGNSSGPCSVLYSGIADCGHYDVLEPVDPVCMQHYEEAVARLRQGALEVLEGAFKEEFGEDTSDLTAGDIIKLLGNWSEKEKEGDK